MTSTRELELVCDACGKPIRDDGNLWVNQIQAQNVMHARQRGDKADRVAWQAHHTACDPEPDAPAYYIDASQLRTWRQLVEWTTQVNSKIWAPATDWNSVLRGAIHSKGTRIVPAA